MAYLTAKTHGLEEEAGTIKDAYESQDNIEKLPPLPEVMPNATLLKPPPPICQTESNWPLLTVSKGFFEGIKAVRGGGPGVPGVGTKGGVSSALVMNEDDDEAAPSAGAGDKGGWGDDDEAGFGSEGEDLGLEGEKTAPGDGSDGGKWYRFGLG